MSIYNSETDHEAVQIAVDDIYKRTDDLGLKINNRKCAFKSSEGRSQFAPVGQINGEHSVIPVLDRKCGLTYLGVALDSNLNWSLNTDVMVTKAKRAIGSLRRSITKYLSVQQRRLLICSKVLPITTATFSRLKGDRLALERLNRFACKVITNNYRASYSELLSQLASRPIFQEVNHRRILLASRYSSGTRYQPPGTVNPLVQNPRLRNRSHPRSLALNNPTSRYVSDSSLEMTIRAWNLELSAHGSGHHQFS